MIHFCVPQSDLQQGKLSAYLIGEYRVLWLQLSKLTSDVGKIHQEHLFRGKCVQCSEMVLRIRN
jgi:hypothetical protein